MIKLTGKDNWTVERFLKALSVAEYPDYIISMISSVQEWMQQTLSGGEGKRLDPVTAMFEGDIDPDLNGLFERLSWLQEYADVLPNDIRPEGRDEVVVLNVGMIDTDSVYRMGIDYASVFNYEKCKRVWLVSDTFSLQDAAHYHAHISKLTGRGIVFRFLLITPWGWAEIPLSGNEESSQIFWHNTVRGENKRS